MDADTERLEEMVRVVGEDLATLKETMGEVLSVLIEMNETVQEAMR